MASSAHRRRVRGLRRARQGRGLRRVQGQALAGCFRGASAGHADVDEGIAVPDAVDAGPPVGHVCVRPVCEAVPGSGQQFFGGHEPQVRCDGGTGRLLSLRQPLNWPCGLSQGLGGSSPRRGYEHVGPVIRGQGAVLDLVCKTPQHLAGLPQHRRLAVPGHPDIVPGVASCVRPAQRRPTVRRWSLPNRRRSETPS